MKLDQVTVVIPCYNEEEGIASTLKDLLQTCPGIKVIVVNDGSTDRSSEVVSQYSHVRLLTNPCNQGYGASLKMGCRACETPLVAWFDADGQHRSEDLKQMIEKLEKENLDACFGMRDRHSSFVVSRLPGKACLRWVSQIVARRKIPDLNCGLRVFKTNLINKYLHLLPNGFSASTTSTLLFIKQGYRLSFHSIHVVKRMGTSTVRWMDGFRTLELIVRIIVTFDAALFFTVFSGIQLFVGMIYSLYVAHRDGLGIPVLGALVMLSGVTTFCFGFLASQINQLRRELMVLQPDLVDVESSRSSNPESQNNH